MTVYNEGGVRIDEFGHEQTKGCKLKWNDELLPSKDEDGVALVWREDFSSFNIGEEKTRVWEQCWKYNGRYRPTKWDKIFFKTALEWAALSPDAQTQCGCVLVTEKEIVSTGYNGFMRDLRPDFDRDLPKERPEKYPYMIHAEQNAIYNAARRGRQTIGTTAYITGMPCGGCLQALYQAGISEIRFTNISNPKMVVYGEDYDKICLMASQSMSKLYFPKELIFKE